MLQPKPKHITSWKIHSNWPGPALPQMSVDNAVKDFHKRLQACVFANNNWHFVYKMWWSHSSCWQLRFLYDITRIWSLCFRKKVCEFRVNENWTELLKSSGYFTTTSWGDVVLTNSGKWTKIGRPLGMWLGNDSKKFYLQRPTVRENIPKHFGRGLLFWLTR